MCVHAKGDHISNGIPSSIANKTLPKRNKLPTADQCLSPFYSLLPLFPSSSQNTLTHTVLLAHLCLYVLAAGQLYDIVFHVYAQGKQHTQCQECTRQLKCFLNAQRTTNYFVWRGSFLRSRPPPALPVLELLYDSGQTQVQPVSAPWAAIHIARAKAHHTMQAVGVGRLPNADRKHTRVGCDGKQKL